MLGWLKRLLPNPGKPVNAPDAGPPMPEGARWYLQALSPYLDRPFVHQHFHQVTWFSSV